MGRGTRDQDRHHGRPPPGRCPAGPGARRAAPHRRRRGTLAVTTMLLAIDVGNTNVTIGVFDGEHLAHSWRLAALRERTADELGIFVTRLFEQMHVPAAAVHGIAVASAVPPLTRPMEEMCERYFSHKALIVDATNAGMTVRYSPVGDVGADRIVNAVAAWAKYGKTDAVPLIVVDFGTGTTFDVISTAGEYLGGVICPGINISAEGLPRRRDDVEGDRKSTRLNSSHQIISYAVFC